MLPYTRVEMPLSLALRGGAPSMLSAGSE